MKDIKITIDDWDSSSDSYQINYKADIDNVESISFSYDRGRFSIYINDTEVVSDSSGMSDFTVEIKKAKK